MLRDTSLAVVAVTFAILAVGCASATTVWSVTPASNGHSPRAHIFVAPAAVDIGAASGNVGQNVSEIERTLTQRILSIVREADPDARLADATGPAPFTPMASYIDAVAPGRTSRSELDAAGDAVRHGGTSLLVPTIVAWRTMRTDDPIGAVTVDHNRVVIALRFVRLEPVALVGSVTFENHARLTLNQSPERLLNDEFRKTVLQLVR
jgi:hypothetical protein